MKERVSFRGYDFVCYKKSVGMKGVKTVLFLDREPTQNDLGFLADLADSFYSKGRNDKRDEIKKTASDLYTIINQED